MDNSSTANILARCLGTFKDLNIVTTNLETAIYLNLHTQNKISIIGGNMIDTYTSSMSTVEYLMDFVFDISFMSCRGVSLKYGVTDKVESESNVRRALIKRTKKSILLVDSAKFGQALPYKDCELCQISAVVTNEKPDKQYNEFFERNGVEIVY
ncbi:MULTISPECIES: DeoR/GlpR family DNA-binding transcription regulator [Lactobacillus]|uniref:DeoR/GlpR family DNA-binding transcription regulator n=1 Tax=Lactobacillus TaxID=1578 RepID=UPI001E4F81E0|nr:MULTISPECIES: DeoR/GlpR family DNA-binding transcription regulator [Lactobacillus]